MKFLIKSFYPPSLQYAVAGVDIIISTIYDFVFAGSFDTVLNIILLVSPSLLSEILEVFQTFLAQDTLAYYEHNGFVYLLKTEEIERLALKRYDEEGNLIYEIPEDEPLHTRMRNFDLK